MATDKEASFPIEDFEGINRQIDREDITARSFNGLTNMWEKTIGVVETRYGSEELTEDFPSNVTGIDNIYRVYKNSTDKERIAAIHCAKDVQVLDDFPTGMTFEFVADTDGNWLINESADVRYEPESILLRFYGYGVSYYFRYKVEGITGYATTPSTKYKLQIDISSALYDNNVTGVEVYAVIKNGNLFAKVNDPEYNEMTMWVGNIDLIDTPTGTFDFLACPFSKRSGGSPTELQPGNRTFTFETIDDVSGNLIPGKTYYVMVLPHHYKTNIIASGRYSTYRQPGVSLSGVTAVTIPEGKNAIRISNVSPTTFMGILAIGEDPQLLVPYEAFHDKATAIYNIYDMPRKRPSVIDLKHTSASLTTYQFRTSDHSTRDMMVNIKDDGSYEPVFVGRLHKEVNEESEIRDYVIDKDWDTSGPTDYIYDDDFVFYYVNDYDRFQQLGFDSKYNFETWRTSAFFVNDHDPKRYESQEAGSQINILHRSGTNYYMTSGIIAATTVMDFQTGSEVRIPSGRYIRLFQEAMLITGGDPVTDEVDGTLSDSSRTVFFSRSINPFDFTVPGAGSPTPQFFTIEQAGERITGMGIYDITTDSGPDSQLFVTKRNSTWVLRDLPVADMGTLPSTYMKSLSNKIGGIHLCFVNTPVGLLVASYENVYLMRGSGEPSPVGDPIQTIIQGANMDNAVGSYHDKQYKLSFYHPDFGGDSDVNNVELWLDINKMKAQKGMPSWKGPMTGRPIDYQVIEDLEGDGSSYDTARNRISIDKHNIRAYKADILSLDEDDVIYDFGEPVEAQMETKDYEISQQDNNWNKLIKRQYWKIRTNRTSKTPLKATEETYIDGVLADSQEISMYGLDNIGFKLQPLKVNPIFTTKRVRGRTLRKVLTTKQRIGIGGFSLFYQVERRRI